MQTQMTNEEGSEEGCESYAHKRRKLHNCVTWVHLENDQWHSMWCVRAMKPTAFTQNWHVTRKLFFR